MMPYVDRRKIGFHFLFFKKQQFKASLELKFDFNHAVERHYMNDDLSKDFTLRILNSELGLPIRK